MNYKKIRKIILTTYMILIVLTFIPIPCFEAKSLEDFLLPVIIFNTIFWGIYSLAYSPLKESAEYTDNVFINGFGIVLLHIPILLILEFIPSPLNALIFGLFAILIMAFS